MGVRSSHFRLTLMFPNDPFQGCNHCDSEIPFTVKILYAEDKHKITCNTCETCDTNA